MKIQGLHNVQKTTNGVRTESKYFEFHHMG